MHGSVTKKIHYCWFGKNPLSELAKKCIDSWKKFCPNYDIIEWNENNFDVNCCRYVKEAYDAKKWAFVSDYCRFYVLYNHGGIYMDTDVELLKPLDDLPNNFIGFESMSVCASGLIRGAEKGDIVCEMMLKSYNEDSFVLDDGQFNLKTVCQRETAFFEEHGLKLDNTEQFILNTKIFPTEYFCPMNYVTKKLHITDKTYSIHHYAYTWGEGKENLNSKIYRLIYGMLGERFANKIKKLFGKRKNRKNKDK